MYALADAASLPIGLTPASRRKRCLPPWVFRSAQQARLERQILMTIESETVRRLRISIETGETISAIASDLGLTAQRHRAAFRAVAGLTPDKLRGWMRVELAFDQLHNDTEIDALSLAKAVGLSNPRALDRLLLRLTGEHLEAWRTRIAFDQTTGRAELAVSRKRP